LSPQRRTLVAASLGFFLVVLDTTIVNVALPSIGEDLDADLSDLQWVVDAYVVVFAGLLLSSGSLADRIGADRCYSLGMAAFAIASLACAAAPSLEILLAARVVQGAAAALLLPSSLSLIRQAFPDASERAHAIGIWAAIGGGALAAGPVLGGVLTDGLDWRAIFVINLPFAVAAVLLTAGAPRVPRHRDPLDFPGQVAAIVAIVALTFAVIEGGHEGLGSPPARAAVLVAAIAVAAFVAVERRSRHPAVPFELFRSRVLSSAVAIGLIFNFAFYGQVFVLSLFFQQVLGQSAFEAGLMFLPLTALITGVNLVAGRVTASRGPRPPLLGGQLLMAAGFAAFSLVDAGTAIAVILALLVPIGVGGGFAIPPLTAAMLESVPESQAGLASGSFNAARQFGGGLGVAVFGSMIATDFVASMQASMLLAAVGILVTLWLSAAYIHSPAPAPAPSPAGR
jgi:DHA2 family methylenomycin A resistance protein-like MFS transporter